MKCLHLASVSSFILHTIAFFISTLFCWFPFAWNFLSTHHSQINNTTDAKYIYFFEAISPFIILRTWHSHYVLGFNAFYSFAIFAVCADFFSLSVCLLILSMCAHIRIFCYNPGLGATSHRMNAMLLHIALSIDGESAHNERNNMKSSYIRLVCIFSLLCSLSGFLFVCLLSKFSCNLTGVTRALPSSGYCNIPPVGV